MLRLEFLLFVLKTLEPCNIPSRLGRSAGRNNFLGSCVSLQQLQKVKKQFVLQMVLGHSGFSGVSKTPWVSVTPAIRGLVAGSVMEGRCPALKPRQSPGRLLFEAIRF